MHKEMFKNVVIGSGAGGKLIAWHLAKAGESTVVIERRYIGGSCPNINCLPSKNEIWSAKVIDLARHGERYGLKTGPVSVDMTAVRRRKREMVDGLSAAQLSLYKASGANLLMGEARLTGTLTVEVRQPDGTQTTIRAERLFLNVGTHATIPSIPGLAESQPLTNIELLELDRPPEHLIVIGGGYVGLEFAQAYRRFGSRVTIIQHGPQLLKSHDPDVAKEVERFLQDEGVQIVAPSEISRVEGRSGQSVRIGVRTPSGEQTIAGSDILVAVGRTPNTAGIGLEKAGVELDAGGYIKVNDRLETTAPKTWALGECAGSPPFTHISEDDFRIVRDNLAGGRRSTKDRQVPSCLFTDPEVAHVGLTETDARRRGIPIRAFKAPTAAVLRTRATGENRGFMKALVDERDRIVGFTM